MYQRVRGRRTMWVHPLNNMRLEKSEYFTLTLDLRQFDDRFYGMYRMHVPQFDDLVNLLMPELEKMTTNYREPLSPQERLIITLT